MAGRAELSVPRAANAPRPPFAARLLKVDDANLPFRTNSAPALAVGRPFTFYLNGWSARGGFTRNPYLLGFDPSGSSSGSAVAVAANLCACAVGTETDGSIVVPAGINLIVGLKPTLGLIAQDGIIPITHSQDTAGPMGRTVADVAVLLGAMRAPVGALAGQPLPADYTRFLQRGSLRGARIGIDTNVFFTYTDPDQAAVAWAAVERMAALGATLIDSVSINDPLTFYADEYTVMQWEFKVGIERYLSRLGNTRMRTLADLIAFNNSHCAAEMAYYGQDDFEAANATSGDLSDPAYTQARSRCIEFAWETGLKAAFTRHALDAIVIPSYGWSSSHAAVAGYPNLALPVGTDAQQRPVGLCLVGKPLAEPRLIGLAYDLEQSLRARRPPQFLGTPYQWPEAGLCAAGNAKGARGRGPANVGRKTRLRRF